MSRHADGIEEGLAPAAGADEATAAAEGTGERAPEETGELDLETLKALAHPLRVKILDLLSTYGPATASGLADRLGESSGATSYHLRQLARHSLVREVDGRGTGRERWWERRPGPISLTSAELMRSPAGRSASRLVVREWSKHREQLLHDFLERGVDELAQSWNEASIVHTSNASLTSEQLGRLNREVTELVGKHLERYRGQSVPGMRPVQIQYNGFPVLDGVEHTEDAPVPRADEADGAETETGSR
ncbi:ArsR/SmtB family transcription factor [Ruicaihuangia caeni]|uniref:ArsR/SmtB family transcription factor n=1 Tax=Ruicaihuangia caeni TaxID=3042517 RepID=UPI00338FA45B